ncbi:hypothetical protein H8R18_00770 [Nanchangia anserum]|uniref:Uncharacterized protein n=1 Tax=Nanchangia anserum TaxID=2692125 RepID=A0A8I0G9S3_9ACTO|nr:hypothetical protein [Nanchangia anserum]MBD3689774.1 hypothetical protein [Nanchangia anserum]QOX81948.1 hypothetical protein H8R18_00770 [Nanchangia anserum]
MWLHDAVMLGGDVVHAAMPVFADFDLDIHPTPPPGAEKISELLNMLQWVCAALAVVGLMGLGATLMWRRHNGGENGMEKLLMIFGGLVLISTPVSIVSYFVK